MPRTMIVIGLGNGDEGKGSLVDHLVRRHGARRVVRFNGGAQARHHVVHGGVSHGFSQFGSGTLAHAGTVLSRFMLMEPLGFCREARDLAGIGVPDPFSLVTVSAKAPIVTQANILANRIMETHRGAARHGSCGLGIGLTQGDVEEIGVQAVFAGDLGDPAALKHKLHQNWRRRLEDVREIESEATLDMRTRLATPRLDDLVEFYREFARQIRVVPDPAIAEIIAGEDTVLEGAQGVLLDQEWGFFPHVTRSTTTFANAETLLDEAGFQGERLRIGLLRAYATRHGAGPLPTETDGLAVPPCHNGSNPWQGAFRVGWFDAVTARYALEACGGIDLLALTNVDRLAGLPQLKACVAYQPDTHLHDGTIAPTRLDGEASLRRTAALLHARAEYRPLRPIESARAGELWRFADVIGELVGRKVDSISARADAQKLYRVGGLLV